MYQINTEQKIFFTFEPDDIDSISVFISGSEIDIQHYKDNIYYITYIFTELGTYIVELKKNNKLVDIKCVDIVNQSDKIDMLLDAQFGNWEIKNNKMYIYKDGKILFEYNLYNKLGEPTEDNVFKRILVDN